MLFNSYLFIFVFLPIALIGYFALARTTRIAPIVWLALASLLFYSISGWRFILLLLASIAFNYVIGWLLIARQLSGSVRRATLALGVVGDLLTLGYFKYAGFLVANLDTLFGTSFAISIVLPVGISFYTFTQIAFLVDAYRG